MTTATPTAALVMIHLRGPGSDYNITPAAGLLPEAGEVIAAGLADAGIASEPAACAYDQGPTAVGALDIPGSASGVRGV